MNADSQKGVLVGLVLGTLALLLASYVDGPAQRPASTAPQVPSPVDRWLEDSADRQRVAHDEDVTVRREAAPAPAAAAAPEHPTAASFSFLGKMEEQGRHVVVLQGGGRTLKVAGPGPIDNDYVADAFAEGYVIVRHVRLGTSQLVELTAVRRSVDPGWSPADSAQD